MKPKPLVFSFIALSIFLFSASAQTIRAPNIITFVDPIAPARGTARLQTPQVETVIIDEVVACAATIRKIHKDGFARKIRLPYSAFMTFEVGRIPILEENGIKKLGKEILQGNGDYCRAAIVAMNRKTENAQPPVTEEMMSGLPQLPSAVSLAEETAFQKLRAISPMLGTIRETDLPLGQGPLFEVGLSSPFGFRGFQSLGAGASWEKAILTFDIAR